MPKYKLFEFTVQIVNRFREKKIIPIDFYNKDGQILIPKKEEASQEEIERLLKFINQGIYYNEKDSVNLGITESKQKIPEGLTATKLLSKEYTGKLIDHAQKLYGTLKKSSSSSHYTNESKSLLNGLFEDFASQPDAMSGLINIIELMKNSGAAHQVELAIKRSVVAMALKTRGMQGGLTPQDIAKHKKSMNDLMLSAFLCDVGYFRMDLPQNAGLSEKQMGYIKNHPLMSYLLIAHDSNVSSKAKNTVLIHHSSKLEGVFANNYPEKKFLKRKLNSIHEKIQNDSSKKKLSHDIGIQLGLLESTVYNEDASIVAIASEFSSLSSKVPWRDAFEPERAVKMIVNNSFFTYPGRILKEFLDYISISLCNNKMIIKEGDFVIVVMTSHKGDPYFEVCRIDAINRLQSRPEVLRIGTLTPLIEKSPKYRFKTFRMEDIKPDPRKARFNLNKDDTRTIAYIVDPDFDKELYQGLLELSTSGKKYIYSKAQKKYIPRAD